MFFIYIRNLVPEVIHILRNIEEKNDAQTKTECIPYDNQSIATGDFLSQ